MGKRSAEVELLTGFDGNVDQVNKCQKKGSSQKSNFRDTETSSVHSDYLSDKFKATLLVRKC